MELATLSTQFLWSEEPGNSLRRSLDHVFFESAGFTLPRPPTPPLDFRRASPAVRSADHWLQVNITPFWRILLDTDEWNQVSILLAAFSRTVETRPKVTASDVNDIIKRATI
jgi:hypothetical protein